MSNRSALLLCTALSLGTLFLVGSAAWSLLDQANGGMRPMQSSVEDFPLEGGAEIADGPLAEVDPYHWTKDAFDNIQFDGRPVHFASTNGKWRILVFFTLAPVTWNDTARVKLPPWMHGLTRENSNSLYFSTLKQLLGNLPDTEIWAVRMNHYGPERSDPYGLFDGPDGAFWISCHIAEGQARNQCYDRFIYAGYTEGGADGYYFWPQVNWFYKTFPFFATGADQGPGSAVVILDPSGHAYFDSIDECVRDPGGPMYGACGTYGNGFEIRSVRLKSLLAVFDKVRVKEGYSAILTTRRPAKSVGFWSYVAGNTGGDGK